MENNELYKSLLESIVNIYDENNIIIKYDKVELKEYVSKYSSSHKPRLTLFIDDKPYGLNKNYKIEYKCKTCGRISTILLKKFLLKKTLHCTHCTETQEKKDWHSYVLKKIHNGENYTKINSHKKRTYDFDSESSEFKKEYYNNNLTIDEFNYIKDKIFSIKGIDVSNKKFELLEHENGINHKKYRQMILIDGIKYPFKDINLKCECCEKTFHITRPIKERVLKNNFLCNSCNFNNNIFLNKKK